MSVISIKFYLSLFRFIFFACLLCLIFISFSCNKDTTKEIDLNKYYNLSSRYYTEFNDSIHNIATKLDTHNVLVIDLPKIYVIYGQSSLLLANYEESIAEFLKAKNILKDNRNDTILLRVMFGLGNAYTNLGQFDNALNSYFEAERIARDLNLKIELGKSYGGISQVFQIMEDLNNAKRFIFKAIPLLKDKKSSYYNAQLTLANIYGMSGKTDSAFYIDNYCLNEIKDHKDEIFESFFYNNKGNCYMYSGGYDSAAIYFKKCLAIDTLYAETKQKVDSYINLVTLYSLKNDSNELNKYFRKAHKLCDQTKFIPGIVQLYQSLNAYYSSRNDHKRASQIKDSLFHYYKALYNQRTEDKISQLKVRYDDEKRLQEIRQREEQILSQRIIITLTLLVFFITIIFGVNYFSQIKKRRAIEIQKVIDEQNHIATSRVFLSEQQERMRIARDLHDSIGQKLAALKMQASNSNTTDNGMITLLNSTITEVRNISHNLIPEELNFGFYTAIENLIETSFKNKKVSLSIDENCKKTDISQLQALNTYRVLQELIANNLKHSQSNQINISLLIDHRNLCLTFKDNGQKINVEQLKTSGGIGWKNIFARLNLINANINFSFEAGNIIKIIIPLNNASK